MELKVKELKLSAKDREIYGLMRSYYLKRRKPMSIRSIQREVGFYSSSSVQYHIKRLKALGYLDEERIPLDMPFKEDYFFLNE